MFILFMPIHLMNKVQMNISMDYWESSFQNMSLLKELNHNLLEDYTNATNERPRRIQVYLTAKNLFKIAQTAWRILT